MNKLKIPSFNLISHISVLVAFIILKIGYKFADTQDLLCLIKPVDVMLSFILGSTSVYSENGFYFSDLNIVIDKSCSGFNLMLIAFLVFYYQLSKRSKLPIQFIKNSLLSLVLAYVFTVFVNSSRILSSILIQSKTQSFINYQHLIHESIGIINNLTFLILAYLIIEKLISKKSNYEKLA